MSLLDSIIHPRMQRLLAAFLVRPERSLSVNDVLRIVGSSSMAQKSLRGLHTAGVVTEQRVGNQRRFQANQEFPLYAELRAICVKTFGVVDKLAAALEPMRDAIDLAFVFGSVAEGRDRADSDIDIIAVGDGDCVMQISEAMYGLEQELGRPIHLNFYGGAEWATLLATDPVIGKIAEGTKLMVIGNGMDAGVQ